MARKRQPISHDEVVRRFAARLRELRRARGMTQAELARAAHVTVTYVGRLENEGPLRELIWWHGWRWPSGVELGELLPAVDPPDPDEVLQAQARRLFDRLMQAGERDVLQLLVPLLARLAGDSPPTSR